LPLHVVRHRRPNRAFIGVLELRNQSVQERMRIAPKSVPIRGIERRLRGFWALFRHFDFCFRFGL
jgi:hypothetical protein